jgi:hypothetical protein
LLAWELLWLGWWRLVPPGRVGSWLLRLLGRLLPGLSGLRLLGVRRLLCWLRLLGLLGLGWLGPGLLWGVGLRRRR